jgi:hypothetical protein
VCPDGAGDLGRISQADVTRYIERHARDWSADSGKAMCWAVRSFLRYVDYSGLNPLSLAGCVPSIRRWKLASLPTYMSAAQVQKVLDGCDLTTAVRLDCRNRHAFVRGDRAPAQRRRPRRGCADGSREQVR